MNIDQNEHEVSLQLEALEHRSIPVMISDLHDHKVIYLNSAAKMLVEKDKNLPNPLIFDPEKVQRTEKILLQQQTVSTYFYDNDKKHHYMVTSYLVTYQGKKVRLDSLLDLSSKQKFTKENLLLTDMALESNKILEKALSQTEPETGIQSMLSDIGKLLHLDRTYVFEFNDSGNLDNTFEWVREGIEPKKEGQQNVPYSYFTQFEEEFHQRGIIIIPDVSKEKRFPDHVRDYMKEINLHSLTISPLLLDNRNYGFVGFDNLDYQAMEILPQYVKIISHFLVLLLRNRDLLKALERDARVDYMTGIYNRRGYEEYLKNHTRKDNYGIIYGDLNGLKKLNDTFGHHQGDEYIIHAAKIFSDLAGKENCFRMGGDEFMMIKEGIGLESLMELVDRMKEAFEENHISIALGYSYMDSQSDNIEAFVSKADHHMYAVKQEMKRQILQNN